MRRDTVLPLLAVLLMLLCGCGPTSTEPPLESESVTLTEERLSVEEGSATEPHVHTLTETLIPPTCTEEGHTHYACACGYAFEGDYVPPTGHTLTETLIPPTCTEEGHTYYACACGYAFEGDYVPPTGHTLTETLISPTCTEEGYTEHTCDHCTYAYVTDLVLPLAHANARVQRVYPTPTQEGYHRFDCPDCGESRTTASLAYADIVTGAYTSNTIPLMRGVDTSMWNHEYGESLEDPKPLDFHALKAAGVDFVLLKAGSSKGKDPTFEMDYENAKAAGLQVGAYFYTYAATREDTAEDLELLLSWLEGKQFELPIYFDLEDESLQALDRETLTELCRFFVEGLWESGWYGALYTNTEWLYNRLDTQWVKEGLEVWYARYTAKPQEGEARVSLTEENVPWRDGTASLPGETECRYGLWQFTDNGGIEGFRYPFDFNYAFKDYRAAMLRWGLNGFSLQTPVPSPWTVGQEEEIPAFER